MQAQVQDIGPCKKKLTIEITPDEIKQAIESNIGNLRQQAILPGFRKGHAPIELIEKRFGADIRKEVKANLIVENYKKAVEEQKLQPIADPDIDLEVVEMKEGEPMRFDLAVEVWPEFDVAGYEGLELEKPSAEPSDAEVEAEISALRMRTTTFEETTEGAAETDFVIASYKIVAGGETVHEAKEAGIRPADSVVARMKVEGLGSALLGKKAGESVTVDFKVPEEFHEENWRGKDASVTVDISTIRRPCVPDATEEWAKELGFESLDELKSVIKRNVAASKEHSSDEALRMQVYEKLLEKMKFDLPEEAVRRQQADVLKREQAGLRYHGVTEEDLAKVSDKLEEASLERAGRDLKLFFILSRISEKEGIKAAAADVEMRVAELATRYRTTTAKMRERLEREEMLPQIALQVREEKTVSHILSKAVIKETAAPQALPESAQPAKPRVVAKEEAEAKEA